ncbi:MAG TPA: PPOX class F420-dependent oxidoreductase [Kineosporiaceae bacterium]|nr:PPOX class F420-dependent oxidoreductase [Kineosporiaceae bacterium]
MNINDALDFVRTNSHAVLSTQRRDGTPQLSPVTVGVDAHGRVIISSRQTAIKTKNLIRDPRAWLAVFSPAFYGQWVQISGPAEIVNLPQALPLLEDYYRSVSGEHPDWDDYRAAMIRDQRCLIRITPTAAGPNVSG